MHGTTKGSWKFASVIHHYEYVGSSEIEMNENPERERRGEEREKRESIRKNEKRLNREIEKKS